MQSIAVILAYFLDLIFGDPRWFPHPVKGMGKLIIFFEKILLKKTDSKQKCRRKGILLAIFVIGISTLSASILLKYAGKINPFWGYTVWIFLAYTTIAGGDLFTHANAIKKEIKNNRLHEARLKLSRIVGRNTQNLSKEEVARAAIESIAENTTDGIISPLFYLFLGGPVLAIGYKAVSTLDSMVGYKNEKYTYFGWFSAKLDDVMNFIPARITGFFISTASFILKKDGKNSVRIMLRDGQKHPSPNSAISQAAIAGALGIKLGGPRYYEGKLLKYSYIGEEKRDSSAELISESLIVCFAASLLMLLTGVLLQWLI